MQTISSRAFTDNVAAAKRSADEAPVFITDRGQPAHVLMSIEQYRALTGPTRNLHELLAVPGLDEIEFDPPRIDGRLREVDFT